MHLSTQSDHGLSQSRHTALRPPDKQREEHDREAGMQHRMKIHTGSQPRNTRLSDFMCVASSSFCLFFSEGAYSKSVPRLLGDVKAHSPGIYEESQFCKGCLVRAGLCWRQASRRQLSRNERIRRPASRESLEEASFKTQDLTMHGFLN